MKCLAIPFLARALAALTAGCAGKHSSVMGAGPASGTTCRDGTVLPTNSRCAVHGGVASGTR